MTCTVPHDETGLPELLCRVCHPELNTDATTRSQLDREEVRLMNKRREVALAEHKLAAANRKLESNPVNLGIETRIAKSLTRKVERLHSELAACTDPM